MNDASASIDDAVRAAFTAGDGDALRALAAAHASLKECAHFAPWLHRVGDVACTPRGSVRLLRCVACDGRLYLRAQRTKAATAPGLALDLSLDAQRAYVASASRSSGDPGAAR